MLLFSLSFPLVLVLILSLLNAVLLKLIRKMESVRSENLILLTIILEENTSHSQCMGLLWLLISGIK